MVTLTVVRCQNQTAFPFKGTVGGNTAITVKDSSNNYYYYSPTADTRSSALSGASSYTWDVVYGGGSSAYIQGSSVISSSGAYIDTGTTYTKTNNFDIKFYLTSTTGVTTAIAQVFMGDNNHTLIQLKKTTSSITSTFTVSGRRCYGSSGSTSMGTLSINSSCTITSNGSTFIKNGTSYSVNSGSVSGGNLYLFWRSNAGGNDYTSSMRLYYFKLYDGSITDGTLVRDYIPILYGSTYCLFDNCLSGDVIYESANSSSFSGDGLTTALTYDYTPPVQITISSLTLTTPSTIDCGQAVTANVVASTDGSTLTYQWYSSTDNSTWTAMTNQTSATMSYSTAPIGNNYYKVIVSSDGASLDSIDAGFSSLQVRVNNITIDIATLSELHAFATRVNNGEVSLNARLTADIDVSESDWVKIGTDTYPYAGVFDGNGHTLANFNRPVDFEGGSRYYYFYGDSTNSVVKNTKFTNILFDTTTSLNTASADTDRAIIYKISVVDCVWFDNVVMDNYPTQLYSNYWAEYNTIRNDSTCTITNCIITNSSASKQYGGILSGKCTNAYLEGTTIVANSLQGSPTSWISSSVFKGGGYTVSDVFVNYDDVSGRAYSICRIGYKDSSSGGEVVVSNCYSADTFTVSGSTPTTYTTKNERNGESVSSSVYSQQGFFDGTGVDGTIYLDWDFTNTWYWDSLNNVPRLQVFRPDTPTVKVYNGSEWVDGTPQVYTSNGWVTADSVYIYTANGWVEKV